MLKRMNAAMDFVMEHVIVLHLTKRVSIVGSAVVDIVKIKNVGAPK